MNFVATRSRSSSFKVLHFLPIILVSFFGLHHIQNVNICHDNSVSEVGIIFNKVVRNESSSSSGMQIPTQTHTIPRILIFTYLRDLLSEQEVLTDEDEIALAANVRRTIDKHSNDTLIRFLTDEDCITSLQKTFPTLVKFFMEEKEGMYKSDVCRGSALYETGGVYLDIDVGVRKDLWLDLKAKTEFLTALEPPDSDFRGLFFQAIFGASPQSPIVYKYLELFERHYTGKDRIEEGLLGVTLLRRAWDHVYDNVTRSPPTELYQEVRYWKHQFPNLSPAPTWGDGPNCRFIVIAPVNNITYKEESWDGMDIHIPLYSRIPGGRLCSTKPQTPK